MCSSDLLAVLFGGQEFFLAPFDIQQQQKDELIQTMAEVWGRVQANNPLPPEDTDQVKLMYPVSEDANKIASQAVEEAIRHLALIKKERKALEDREDQYQTLIQGYMGSKDTLVTVDGQVLATWKSAKASKRFSADLFKQAMPDIYNQFIVESAGSRRFLVK